MNPVFVYNFIKIMSKAFEDTSWFDHVKCEHNGDGCVSVAAAQSLYREHEVKPELVLGPELLQPQDVAYSILRQFGPLIKLDKDAVNQVSETLFCGEQSHESVAINLKPLNAHFIQKVEENGVKQEYASKATSGNEHRLAARCLEQIVADDEQIDAIDAENHKQDSQAQSCDQRPVNTRSSVIFENQPLKKEQDFLAKSSIETSIETHCIHKAEDSSEKQRKDSQSLSSDRQSVNTGGLEQFQKNTVKVERDFVAQSIDQLSIPCIQHAWQDSVFQKEDLSSFGDTGYTDKVQTGAVKQEVSEQPFGTRCIEQLLTPCLVKVDRLPDMKPLLCPDYSEIKNNPYVLKHVKEYTLEISGEPIQTEINLAHVTTTNNEYTNQVVENSKEKHVAVKIKYHCETCGKQFTAKSKLKSHSRKHREKPKTSSRKRVIKEKNYSCDNCGKWFDVKMKLIAHIRVHLGFEPYACGTCGGQFSTRARLERHEGAHMGFKPYICDICDKRYARKYSISMHIMSHMGMKLNTCKICKKGFVRKSSVKQHEFVHMVTKPYTCELCQKQFKRRRALNNHILTHIPVKEVICEICGNTFTSHKSLKKHKLIHDGIKPYPCEYCKKKYRTRYAMRLHTKRVHMKGNTLDSVGSVDLIHNPHLNGVNQIETKEIIAINKIQENQPENTHGEISLEPPLVENSASNNDEHVTNHKPPEIEEALGIRDIIKNLPTSPSASIETQLPIPFETCPGGLEETPDVTESGSPVHTETSTDQPEHNACDVPEVTTIFQEPFEKKTNNHVPEETMIFQETCDKKTDNHTTKETILKLELTLEIDEDAAKKPFSCDTCGKRYAEKNQLIPHFRVHTGEFRCEFCDKTFAYACYLSKHKQKHVEKPMRYSCDVCEMKFKGIRSLQAHVRIHTGEKLHPCKLCDKQFNASFKLRTHMRTHTGEKPYFCDICNKQFRQHGNLKRHKLTHSADNKPYSCDVCQKRFVTKAYAAIHKKIHTEIREKPYTCEICSKQFLYINSYRGHKHKLHGGPREKKYTCKICDAKFHTSSHLTRHEQIHGGVKPFSCELCGKRFYSKTHLGRHTQNQKRPCVD